MNREKTLDTMPNCGIFGAAMKLKVSEGVESISRSRKEHYIESKKSRRSDQTAENIRIIRQHRLKRRILIDFIPIAPNDVSSTLDRIVIGTKHNRN